jgi:hypothetical protein
LTNDIHEDETGSEQNQFISMTDLMWNLPLFDNLFLSMQGQNVMLVDFHLRDLEAQLLRELIDQERTPIPDTLFVSALSQMWIFGVYELLRTWRQIIGDLKKAAARPAQEAPINESRSTNLADVFWRQHLEEFLSSEEFRNDVEGAWKCVEPVFRRIEALRMNLAKHEIPKSKGERAMAPGYGRIDYSDGSIYWTVDLGKNEVEMVSRRSLSDHLRQVVIGQSIDGDEDEIE